MACASAIPSHPTAFTPLSISTGHLLVIVITAAVAETPLPGAWTVAHRHGVLDHTRGLFLTFREAAILFSMVAEPLSTPTVHAFEPTVSSEPPPPSPDCGAYDLGQGGPAGLAGGCLWTQRFSRHQAPQPRPAHMVSPWNTQRRSLPVGTQEPAAPPAGGRVPPTPDSFVL